MKLSWISSAILGIFLGIFFAYKTNFSSQIFFVSFVLFLINIIFYFIYKNKIKMKRSETIILFIIIYFFIFSGILLGQNSISKDISQKKYFEEYISQKDKYEGVIYKIKETENSSQLFIKLNSQIKNQNFNIKVITQKLPKYKIGEILSLKGKIYDEKILLPRAEDRINKSFNTALYDRLLNIEGEMSFPEIKVLGREENFLSNFKSFKYKLIENLDKVSPRNVSALSSGMIFGDDSLFSKKDTENFQRSGLSHIIVLSGFNISILILFFGILFLSFRIKLFLRTILTILFIIIFIIFVGGEASVLRAGIMGSAMLLTALFGKQYVAKQFLFFAAFIMIIINPKIALYDVSFHLSFLATFAILYLVPIFDNYKFFQKDESGLLIKNIFEILKITLAVQIFVSPYIMFIFGKISIFGFIANILVLPIIPLLMLLGVIIILFSFIFSPIAVFFSYISFIFSKYIFEIANEISKIYISNPEIHISAFFMAIMYIVIFLFIYFEKKSIYIKKYLIE